MENKIAELERRIRILEQRRIYQSDVAPEEIKQRHVGEGVRYLRSGLAADRPDTGEEPLQGTAVYFATDTNVLSIWDATNEAWVDFKRVPASPQTYAASNVTTDRTYDADTVLVAELADIVGTLIADLRSIGLVA